MRYAIFSDVHANLIAWEAVRQDIDQCEVDVPICLGDVVGYGPRPMEVLDGIRAVTPNILMGNHDAAAIGALDYSIFNEQAQHSTEWTTRALTEEARVFLSGLPLAIESEGVRFVHAEICNPDQFGYINDPEDARKNFLAEDHHVTFIGHTHHPKVFEWDGEGEVLEFACETRILDRAKRYIVNVGSVGEPRDPDDLSARYVIYDTVSGQLEFRSVPFDIPAYRDDLAMTTLGVKPYFLQVFEQTVGEAQGSLLEEVPAGRLLLAAGGRAGLGRVKMPTAAVPKKGKGIVTALVLFSFLAVAGICFFVVLPKQRGAPESVVLETEAPVTPGLVEVGSESPVVEPTVTVARPEPEVAATEPMPEPPLVEIDLSEPEVESEPPVVGESASDSNLKIYPPTVSDEAPTLDNSYGDLELAYNLGYGGEELSQDGITFTSVSHEFISSPIYGTTGGITIKGSSSGESQDFNIADLGGDLWQTISYTDRGDGLRLEVTGLDTTKAYQIQILLGEPRNKKWLLYDNGLITVTTSSGSCQSINLTFGNDVADHALLRFDLTASESFTFEMPKATLGPGVSGIVIHSTTSPGQ